MRILCILLLLAITGCGLKDPIGPTPFISPDFTKGDSLVYINTDSAFIYLSKSLQTTTDSVTLARTYIHLGSILKGTGLIYDAQDSVLRAFSYLSPSRPADHYYLVSAFNLLGMVWVDLKDYDQALACYDSALKYTNDADYVSIIQNNRAVAYKSNGEYKKAISIYDSLLGNFKKQDAEYARTLSNLSYTKTLDDPSYYALPGLWRALGIRQVEGDLLGMNASFYHLSEYYTDRNNDSAFYYAEQMLQVAKKLGSPDDELEAINKMIESGKPSMIPGLYSRYKYLSDSIQELRRIARNQFAVMQYDFEKKNEENLLLQNDNSLKRVKIAEQRLMIYGIIFLLIVIVGILLWWFRKRKLLMKREAERSIRDYKLKTSQKVHDVVANGLYGIMADLEHKPVIDRDSLLDKVEVLYEQSRDLSYDRMVTRGSDYTGLIAEMLTSFAGNDRKIILIGNDDAVWQGLSVRQKDELGHVLQECIVNMKKHSQAKHVVFRFEQTASGLSVQYTDDGIGMDAEKKWGNGLKSTETRIYSLGGSISFGRSGRGGLKIDILIPLDKK